MSRTSHIHARSVSAASGTVRRRIAVVAVLAIALGLGEWLMWLGRDAEVTPWWVSAVYPFFALVAGIRCFQTASKLKLDERRAWICFGLGNLSFCFADSAWGIYDSYFDVDLPSPSIADLGYFLAPAFLGLGVWYWRAQTPTAWLSRVQLGNLGIVVSAFLLTFLFMFYGFIQAPISKLTALTGIGYGILDALVALFGFVVVYLHLWSRRRLVTILILIALISNAAADAYYSYSLVNEGYDPSGPMNLIYLSVACFFCWAAFEQNQLGADPGGCELLPEVEDRARQWETLLPPFAVAAVLVTALAFREEMQVGMLPYVAVATAFFTVSLAVRSWWGHRAEMELRKQAMSSEAKLQRSNLELQSEMQTRALVEEELRHSQKMEALGHLTGGVAHDFNNLLAVIIGNLEMAERTDQVSPSVREYLREAADAASRGASLTQRLLALSHKQSLRPEPIDVLSLIDDMSALLKQSLGEQIEVKIDVEQSGLHCVADRSQLEGAILNLAINARDAMPNGGKLRMEASRIAVDEIRASEHAEMSADEYIAISVRDTGAGIPPEILNRVFEPFYTTKGMGEGTGLGLSMVYGFAKQSCGRVEIDSTVGEGTEVTLYLPSSEALPRIREPGEDFRLHRGRGESLLVVEDEPALRRLVVMHLEDLGYSVVAVADGEEMLSVIDSIEAIDLLLSDVMLPGEMSGRDVAAEVTRRRPEVKVLLMSGYAGEDLARKGSVGSDDVLLTKPFQLNDLARMVRKVLDS